MPGSAGAAEMSLTMVPYQLFAFPDVLQKFKSLKMFLLVRTLFAGPQKFELTCRIIIHLFKF